MFLSVLLAVRSVIMFSLIVYVVFSQGCVEQEGGNQPEPQLPDLPAEQLRGNFTTH